MKKLLLLLTSVALMVSLAACGGEEEPAAEPAAEPAVVEEEPAEEEVVEEEVVEEEVVEEEVVEEEVVEEEVVEEEAVAAELDLSIYDEFDVLMHTCYIGYNEANEEEFAGISFSEDGLSGIVVVSNATESVSFVGDVTVEGDTITVLDNASGIALAMVLTDNGDGSYSLDMGDLGSLLVVGATADDMKYIMAVVDGYTEAII